MVRSSILGLGRRSLLLFGPWFRRARTRSSCLFRAEIRLLFCAGRLLGPHPRLQDLFRPVNRRLTPDCLLRH